MAKGSEKGKRPERELLNELRRKLGDLAGLFPTLTKPAASHARGELHALIGQVEAAIADLDPIKDPGGMFDPTVPDTAGRLVALSLLAQPRVPLARIGRTYGSGIYAIYYTGDHPVYDRISATETPIYVGKADPRSADAKTAREQGPQLYGRLHDHRKSICKVEKHALDNGFDTPLRLAHFECRRLVCATNAQYVAERHLIGIFQPIWNQEIGICWGISKHGDSSGTRANKRSPWDVLHPGRAWAMAEELADKMTPEEIISKIADHLEASPPFADREIIIEQFIAAFAQNPGLTTPEETEAADDENGDETGDEVKQDAEGQA